MFEVGKSYTIWEIDGDGLGYHSATVLEWDAPLLKVSHPNGGHMIHNIASQFFHRAELDVRSGERKFSVDSLLEGSSD